MSSILLLDHQQRIEYLEAVVAQQAQRIEAMTDNLDIDLDVIRDRLLALEGK